MIKFVRLFFIFSFIILITSSSYAKTSTKGKEFCLMFLQNIDEPGRPSQLTVYISSDRNVTGTLTIPKKSYSANFSVAANTTTSMTLTLPLAYIYGSEAVSQTGIFINASDSITVYALNWALYTADASVILPIDALGGSYYCQTYKSNPAWGSEFGIAATEDNTVITITPKTATLGNHAANVPFNINLNRGETYQVQSSGDLTGSYISSTGNCNKFAVFSGTRCTNVDQNCGSCDHLYEQMFPTVTWGKEFITIPFKPRTDVFRIIAMKPATDIIINGAFVSTLGTGASYEFQTSSPKWISSNNPISIMQYMRGGTCESGIGDPFMILLSPVEQQLKNITFNAIPTLTPNAVYSVNIITKTGNNVTLDGANLNFQSVPANNNYSYCNMVVSSGNHLLNSTGTDGFIAYVYCTAQYESYGYSCGATLDNMFVVTESYHHGIQTNDSVYCVNDLIDLHIKIDPDVTLIKIEYGDGTSGTQTNITKVYQSPGKKKIKVIYQLINSCNQDTASTEITINAPPQVEAGISQSICAGSSVKIGKTTSGGTPPYSFVWEPSTGLSDLNSEQTQATPNQTTIYRLLVRDKNGCIGTDSVLITVLPKPSINLQRNYSICPGDTINIGNAVVLCNIPYKVTWNPTLNLSKPDSSLTMAFPKSDQVYYITIKDSNNCLTIDSVKIHIFAKPDVQIAGVAPVCAGTSVDLTATGAQTYTWFLKNIIVGNSQKYSVILDTTTSFIVKGISSDGCTGYDTITIQVNPLPKLNYYNQNAACPKSTVPYGISKQNAVTYSWKISGGKIISTSSGGTIAVDGLSAKSTDSIYITWGTGPTGTIELSAKIDSSGCSRTILVNVPINDELNPTIKPDDPSGIIQFCENETAILSAGPGYTEYKWYKGQVVLGQEISNVATIQVSKPGGKYIINVKDEFACLGKDSITLNFNPQPLISISKDISICLGDSISLTASCSNYPSVSYKWQPVTGLSNPNISNPKASPIKTTSYTVIVKSLTTNCIDSAKVKITVNIPPKPQITSNGILNKISICGDSSATLIISPSDSATGAKYLSYRWYVNDTIVNGNNTNAMKISRAAKIKLHVIDENGCSGDAFYEVQVNNPPTIKVSVFPTEICFGTIATLVCNNNSGSNNSSNNSVKWINISDNIDKDTLIQVRVRPAKTGKFQYKVIVIDRETGCASSDSVSLNVIANPKLNIIYDKEYCAGVPANIKISASEGSPSYKFIFSTKDSLKVIDSTATTMTLKANVSQLSNYIVTLIDSKGCVSVDSFKINPIYPELHLSLPKLELDVRAKNVKIPIALVSEKSLISCAPSIVNLKIKVDMNVLNPIKLTDNSLTFSKVLNWPYWLINISIPGAQINSSTTVIAEIIADAILGSLPSAPLHFDSVSFGNLIVKTQLDDGEIKLNGICETDSARLLKYSNNIGIISVRPIPASGDVTVNISTYKYAGNCRLELVDILGNKLMTKEWTNESAEALLMPEILDVALDLSKIKAGIYHLRYCEGSRCSFYKIIVSER
ncbi:MAG: IgGFc-binding protein [Candidatus Kapabacteria bacterium]|nr:IgGFc-binding protein [Candidatus Kapabacteria bacterium]